MLTKYVDNIWGNVELKDNIKKQCISVLKMRQNSIVTLNLKKIKNNIACASKLINII